MQRHEIKVVCAIAFLFVVKDGRNYCEGGPQGKGKNGREKKIRVVYLFLSINTVFLLFWSLLLTVLLLCYGEPCNFFFS